MNAIQRSHLTSGHLLSIKTLSQKRTLIQRRIELTWVLEMSENLKFKFCFQQDHDQWNNVILLLKKILRSFIESNPFILQMIKWKSIEIKRFDCD